MTAILFAAVAGVFGGMVGSAVEHAMEPEMEQVGLMVGDAYEKATTTGIATAWEDVTKTIVAIPQPGVAAGGDRSVPAEPHGASVDPNKVGMAGRGAHARPTDPLSWFVEISGKISGEHGQLTGKIAQSQKAIMDEQALRPWMWYDADPLAGATQSAQLAGYPLVPTPPIPDQKAYERGFWAAWLAMYAYILEVSDDDDNPGWQAKLQIGKKLRKDIDIAAQKWGQTADDWIREFGAVSKARELQRARGYDQGWKNTSNWGDHDALNREFSWEEAQVRWKQR
jgi:hypothetical protein